MHPSLAGFVAKARAGTPLRVVAFGDSIAFGSQIDPARDESLAFPAQWHEAMKSVWPGCDIAVVNKGVPGNRIDDAHARFARDVVAESPDLVIVEFGINDCWDGPERIGHFETRLRELVARLKTETGAAIVLLTANMLNHDFDAESVKLAWFAEKTASVQNAGWTRDYMERVRAVARESGVPLADGYARWEAARAAGTDTDVLLVNRANHPGREGHRLLAEPLIELFTG